jgi:hypothetical protein
MMGVSRINSLLKRMAVPLLALTLGQDYKGRPSDIIKKAQEAARYKPAFFAHFRGSGLLVKRNTYASENMLALFEKFQFVFYDLERRFQCAWVIHEITCVRSSSNNHDYFKGRGGPLFILELEQMVRNIAPSVVTCCFCSYAE